MDSKILTELTELKDKFNKIKEIISDEIIPTSKNILDKVGDIVTYEFSEEEDKISTEIEQTVQYIFNAIDEFYN